MNIIEFKKDGSELFIAGMSISKIPNKGRATKMGMISPVHSNHLYNHRIRSEGYQMHARRKLPCASGREQQSSAVRSYLQDCAEGTQGKA